MIRKKNRWQWLSAVIISLMMFSTPALAGDLNPSAPPGPTMKTLDQIPPTWDQILPASERFKLVMGGAAVLDKETGLVWERSPLNIPFSWNSAQSHCLEKILGGRYGWRLPAIQELASLMDTSVHVTPVLSSGHPFSNVQSSFYWSSTTFAITPTNAWGIDFIGYTNFDVKANIVGYVWCVRGGQGSDAQ